jgi:PTS system nitrogen regulatory IIA component
MVRDAASLLNISEKTIYRWISQGRLPVHRISGQYRFNRNELLEWATAHRVPLSASILQEEHPQDLPGLADALRVGGIFYRVCGKDKASVLSEIVSMLPLPGEVDRDFLLEVLLARESLGSTGIGNGVAIPHVRNPIVLHIPKPMIALFFLEKPVDFAAIDGKPVHTLFTIVSPTIRGHLHLLARLSYALQQPKFKSVINHQALRDEVLKQADAIDKMVTAASKGTEGN